MAMAVSEGGAVPPLMELLGSSWHASACVWLEWGQENANPLAMAVSEGGEVPPLMELLGSS